MGGFWLELLLDYHRAAFTILYIIYILDRRYCMSASVTHSVNVPS